MSLALSILAGVWTASTVLVVAYGWVVTRRRFEPADPADRHLEQRVSKMTRRLHDGTGPR